MTLSMNSSRKIVIRYHGLEVVKLSTVNLDPTNYTAIPAINVAFYWCNSTATLLCGKAECYIFDLEIFGRNFNRININQKPLFP